MFSITPNICVLVFGEGSLWRCRLPTDPFGMMQAPLKTALEIERGMGYMEPPRLLQPVRHYLGQLLLVLGRASEAQQVSVSSAYHSVCDARLVILLTDCGNAS